MRLLDNTRQPIDTGNPVSDDEFNRGILSWWLPLPNLAGAVRYPDLKNRSHGVVAAGSKWVPTSAPAPAGFWAVHTQAGSDILVNLPATNYPWYLSFWACVTNFSGAFSGLLDSTDENILTAMYDTAGNPSYSWSYGVITLNKWTHFVHRTDTPGSVTTWRDGAQITTQGGAYNMPATDVSFGANIGGGGSVYTEAMYSDIRFGAGDISVPRLYEAGRRNYPTQLRRICSWSVGASAAASYTIPAEGSTFALTGADVTLKRSYSLAVGSGSFGLTGANVGLKRGYPIVASAGAFAETGASVALKFGHKIPVDGGVFTETGAVVGLKRGYPLVVGTGAFALTGNAVGLKTGYAVPVGTGSFALSGTDVGLKHGYPIAVGAGSFAETGSSVALRYGPKLSVGTGAYTLSGSDVSLQYSGSDLIMSAEGGSFSVAGSNVTLAYGRKFVIDSGSFSLTGSSVILAFSRVAAIGSGSYLLNGSAVLLRKSYPLSVGVGSYVLTGSDVSFPYQRVMSVGGGTFALTGSAVTLTYSNEIPGGLALSGYVWIESVFTGTVYLGTVLDGTVSIEGD